MVSKKNALATAIALICTTATFAGDLNAPSAPTEPSSAMYQVMDIYNRLDTGTPGVKRSGSFVEPTTGPASTGRTLDEVMSKAPVADGTNGVSPSGVLAGETYWSLRTDGTWGPQTGTMINNGTAFFYPGTTDQPMGGYYTDSSKVIGDAELTAPNIAAGVDLFGVVGTAKVATGDATDPDVLAGKTYSSTAGASTGTMPNIGDQDFTPTTTPQSISAGYHDGNGTVAGDVNLLTGNIKSGATIFGVAGKTEVVDTTTGDAVSADLLSGKRAWVDGSEVTGSATAGANVSGAEGSKTFTIPNGLYSGSKTATANDADLVTGNIRAGSNIFGVAGKTEVVDTASGDAVSADLLTGKKAWVDGSEITGTANISAYPALVPESGQTTRYDANAPQADDGAGNGVDLPTNNRFTDHSDGTVTDELTGLMWLKDANCPFTTRPWQTALNDVVELNTSGTMNSLTCADYSGTPYTDWRLPTVKELQSLVNFGYFDPALSNAAGTARWSEGNAFWGVVSNDYWSSTTIAAITAGAWIVRLNGGDVNVGLKSNIYYVWPVRAGQ